MVRLEAATELFLTMGGMEVLCLIRMIRNKKEKKREIEKEK